MTDWTWPGSRWWRVDLHTHSPASYDFGSAQDREQPDWTRWIEAARDAGIEAVAVTDHNTAAGIAPLQQAAARVDRAPIILPAVELTATDGTHLLLIMGPDCGPQHVEELLTKAEIPVDQRGLQVATSPLSVEQLLALDCDRGLVIVGAHVNKASGLLEHEGQQRLKELRHPGLIGVEVDPDFSVDETWLDGSRPESPRALHRVWCSDSHGFDQAGRRFTWMKMTRPDLEGLRLALLDGNDSLVPALKGDPEDPNRHADHVIESITVHSGQYIGRARPLTVSFNPWFNAVIGARGTGKSTLVDLCRVTLRREGELATEGEGSLRATFDKRMRVPPSRAEEGLLTPQTRVELIYRKDGQRFELAWDPGGQTAAITRLEGDSRTVEDGPIRDRFPARIYGQKQLFELARAPNSLLAVIDEASQVRGADSARELRGAEARYLSLSAEARALRTQVADLPSRVAALADVRRKAELLQSGGQASVLTAYRQRRRQDSAWSSIQASLLAGTASVRQAAETLVVADLDVPGDRGGDPALAALARAHEQSAEIIADLRRSVLAALEKAAGRLSEVEAGDDATTWQGAMAASAQQYRDVSAQLAAAGIASPDEYRDLLERGAELEHEIAALESSRELADVREREASAALAHCRKLRADLAGRRSEFVQAASSGTLIRVAIQALADRAGFADFLRSSLGIARFDDDHEMLARVALPAPGASWTYAPLDGIVAELRALIADPGRRWPAGDRRFETALRKLPPERIDRLALYSAGDAVEVTFRDPRDPGHKWKDLRKGSPGQQTAALLAFVLGYGSEPIILDQPEDDLDSALIYELLVQRLRESKRSRQIIVVTHNANIVVHGDAELVTSLDSIMGQTQVNVAGGLQEQAIRDEICRVMEGGKDAFERRYRRIMRSGAT